MKKLHYISGILISVFTGLHLFNHAWSIFGAEAHIELMHTLRMVYRNVFVETLLLAAVLVQVVTGLKLVKKLRKTAAGFSDRLQVWSGLYLAVFFLFHVGAVMAGRFVLGLDTNYYFGVAGLVTFPFNLFFVPYYLLAVIAFFGHIAAVHGKKMKREVLGVSPRGQMVVIVSAGILFAFYLLFALSNGFRGVEIPEAYGVMIGN
ncbi:MAG: hypothetical protein IM638_14880 [Bacteroidetes bacterium]|nr:hypothetical protein [Bacteroidota bacterium]